MSNNVGDVKTFTLSGTQTEGFRFVWKWWDGTVDCTGRNSIQKKLNIGGNPAGSLYSLPYSVEVVDARGRSAEYFSTIVVNNPPSVVVGSAVLTQNGQVIPYDTTASVQAYDLEDQALTFAWINGGLNVGAGTVAPIGLVPGTYAGTFIGYRNGYRAFIDQRISSQTDLSVLITDSAGGQTTVAFPLYGFSRTDAYYAPSVAPASDTSDASSQPTVTIGEDATFTIYSAPGVTNVVFVWGFFGTNGWTIPDSSNGESTRLPDGSIRNVFAKPTLGESPGQKIANVTAIDLDHSTFVLITIPVEIISNQPPADLGYVTVPTVPVHNRMIRFEGQADDPNNDILVFRWVFTNPALTVWGRTVYVDTAGMIAGQTVDGTLYVYDRLGAVTTKLINFILA